MSNTTRTEKKLNEAQFKKIVRQMARKAIKEQIAKKKSAKLQESAKQQQSAGKPKVQKITKTQLREMVRDCILESLEKELDKRISNKKTKK